MTSCSANSTSGTSGSMREIPDITECYPCSRSTVLPMSPVAHRVPMSPVAHRSFTSARVALGQDQPESDNPIIAVEAGRKRELLGLPLENGSTLRGGNTGEFHTGLRWIGV